MLGNLEATNSENNSSCHAKEEEEEEVNIHVFTLIFNLPTELLLSKLTDRAYYKVKYI